MTRLFLGVGMAAAFVGLCGILGALFFVARARRIQSERSIDDTEKAQQDMYALQGILSQFASGMFALLLGVCLIVLSYVFDGP